MTDYLWVNLGKVDLPLWGLRYFLKERAGTKGQVGNFSPRWGSRRQCWPVWIWFGLLFWGICTFSVNRLERVLPPWWILNFLEGRAGFGRSYVFEGFWTFSKTCWIWTVFRSWGILNFFKECARLANIVHWRASRRQKWTILPSRGLRYFLEMGLKGALPIRGINFHCDHAVLDWIDKSSMKDRLSRLETWPIRI